MIRQNQSTPIFSSFTDGNCAHGTLK